MRRRKAAPESPEHNAGTYVSHSVLEATFYKKKKKKKKKLRHGMHRPTCIIASLTSPFLTAPVKGLAVPANRASSFLSLKMFNAKRNRIVVTIRPVMDDPPSVLHRCQGLTKLDVTRELR